MNETAINFEGTKNAGEECERRLSEYLIQHGAKDLQIVGHTGTKDYDIICSLGSYEVKRDFRSVSTGNHFIEHSYNGEPSGLAVTKADFFVLFVPDRLKIMRTTELRWFIEAHRTSFRFIEGAGDDGRAGGYLVPKQYFSGLYIAGFNDAMLIPPIPYDPQLRRQRLA